MDALSCDTLTVREVLPAVTVTVPERDDDPVLALTDTVTLRLPLPEEGDTVIHDADLLTDQFVLEVTENDLLPDVFEKLNDEGETDTVDEAAACDTLTVRVRFPAVTVIVPVREEVEVLADAVILTLPLFEPDDDERVSHDTLLLTDQLTLDVMLILCEEPDAVKLNDDGETVKTGTRASCVTIIVSFVLTPILTSIVAVLTEVEVLAAAVTLIVVFLEPDVSDTVIHEALLLTFHVVLEVMVNSFSSEDEAKPNEPTDNINLGSAASNSISMLRDASFDPATYTETTPFCL